MLLNCVVGFHETAESSQLKKSNFLGHAIVLNFKTWRKPPFSIIIIKARKFIEISKLPILRIITGIITIYIYSGNLIIINLFHSKLVLSFWAFHP